MVGLLKPTSGEIKVAGYDVQKDLQKIKEMIGVCPQEAAVYKFLTGLVVVIIGIQLYKRYGKA